MLRRLSTSECFDDAVFRKAVRRDRVLPRVRRGRGRTDCVPQTQVDVTKIVPQVILIGEAHGTVEIPQFTLGVVCSLLKAGKSVILGVEYTGEQQDALNRYLLSPGGAADRQDLLQGRNWKRYSDGRGSVAMFELVDGMRRLRQQGQRVGVLAFQSNENLDVPMEVADRTMIVGEENKLLNRINDADMASTVLRESVLYRRYVLVILSGYSHTSTILSTFNTEMFGTLQADGSAGQGSDAGLHDRNRPGGGAHAHGVKTYRSSRDRCTCSARRSTPTSASNTSRPHRSHAIR